MARRFDFDDFDDLDMDFEFDRPVRRKKSSGNGNRKRGHNPQNRNRRRKQRRNRALMRLIPFLVAVVLIVVILLVALSTGLFESFSYGTEREDLITYFGDSYIDSAVVIDDNGAITEDSILLKDGVLYKTLNQIHEQYIERLYYDVNDNELLYTTDSDIISSVIGSNSYTKGGTPCTTPYVISFVDGEELYIALDYVKLFYNMDINLQGGNGEPYRVRIKDVWGSNEYVNVTKAHSLRTEEDKKSLILKELKEGDRLRVLESGQEWTYIETEDMICGYVENRYISSPETVDDIPVNDVTEEHYSSLTNDTPVVLMWHNIAGVAGNEGIGNILDSTSGITVIAPTWFSVADNSGTISSFATNDYVSAVHSRGMEVWGVVDNFNTEGVSSYEVLSHSAIRAHMIEQLMSYASQYSLDGINVDFETLSADCGEHFVQFIRELSMECRKQGVILSVDNYVPKAYNDFYNYSEQGIFADYVIIMGYDEHYSGSVEAGSVASISYVSDGIDKMVEEVPSNKVINALPLYTRIWEETPKSDAQIAEEEPGSDFIPYNLSCFQTLPCTDAVEYVKNRGAEIVWDETTAQNYATWKSGENTYEVWLEDEQSLRSKLEVMKTRNLGGVAAWQLAYAPGYLWDLLKQYY